MFLSKYEHIFIVCLSEHLKIWLADAALTTLQIVTFRLFGDFQHQIRWFISMIIFHVTDRWTMIFKDQI